MEASPPVVPITSVHGPWKVTVPNSEEKKFNVSHEDGVFSGSMTEVKTLIVDITGSGLPVPIAFAGIRNVTQCQQDEPIDVLIVGRSNNDFQALVNFFNNLPMIYYLQQVNVYITNFNSGTECTITVCDVPCTNFFNVDPINKTSFTFGSNKYNMSIKLETGPNPICNGAIPPACVDYFQVKSTTSVSGVDKPSVVFPIGLPSSTYEVMFDFNDPVNVIVHLNEFSSDPATTLPLNSGVMTTLPSVVGLNRGYELTLINTSTDKNFTVKYTKGNLEGVVVGSSNFPVTLKQIKLIVTENTVSLDYIVDTTSPP